MRTLCIWDIQCVQIFEMAVFFCTLLLIRNFYSGHEQHFKYGKHSLNHHFQYCAHCVYEIYIVFKVFEMAGFFLHILAYSKFELRWFWPYQLWWTLFNSSFQTLRTVCILDLQCFQSFPNCNLFCTFFLLRNFYSTDAHHANNGEHFSSPHFRYCTHWVDEIYSVFTLFEIAVSFLHLG